MAEGGYDPETTNPFDPRGGDDGDRGDDENIPLLPFSKGKPPSFKHPPGTSTPIQHTSTSAHHYNPSFVDETPSGVIHYREVFQDIAAAEIKEQFPNTDTSKYFFKMEDDVVYVKIKKKGLRNIWHPIIKDGEVIVDEGKKKLPKTLRDALGKTVGEIVTERISENKRAEERIKELREQRENAFPEDYDRIDAVIEREQEGINERNQENAAIEEKLPLRQRIKAIFKKYGFTAFAVATAIGTVIGVIVSNLKAGLTKVAKGVDNGLKELGKKLGEILPGMIGAIASFIFRTAGEVIGFLAKNAWLLIVGLVVLAVEQLKKKSK